MSSHTSEMKKSSVWKAQEIATRIFGESKIIGEGTIIPEDY